MSFDWYDFCFDWVHISFSKVLANTDQFDGFILCCLGLCSDSPKKKAEVSVLILYKRHIYAGRLITEVRLAKGEVPLLLT